jgi:hypothetical protein
MYLVRFGIKTEISDRFPVFWAPEISEKVDARGEVAGHVRHDGRRLKGGRMRKNPVECYENIQFVVR